jgi:hypothetical protein
VDVDVAQVGAQGEPDPHLREVRGELVGGPTASVRTRTSTRPWSVAPSQRLGQLRQEA